MFQSSVLYCLCSVCVAIRYPRESDFKKLLFIVLFNFFILFYFFPVAREYVEMCDFEGM